MTVNIPNIEGSMWNIETKTAEIAAEMVAQPQTVVVKLNNEGPCAETLGVYSLLDMLCEKFSYPKNQVVIYTRNQLESHPEYNIKIQPPLYVEAAQDFIIANQHNFADKGFDNDFKHFGLFIGRSNFLRLWISSQIHKDYLDQTMFTFHYDRHVDFHQDQLGIEKLLTHNFSDSQFDDAVSLIKNSPFKLDDVVNEYPVLVPAHFNIAKVYNKFLVEIVCETYFSGKSFYPTEKTWRPIILKTPFIVQGPANYYNNLRKLGFKTFNRFWDEGWSEDPFDCQPAEIIKIVDRISKMSVAELKDMHSRMQPTLDHNYNVFMNMKSSDFNRVFDYE
jgi:hypothetical protein